MRQVLEAGETAIPIVKELGYSQECSACSGQYPQMRYFDFDAAHDGGFYGDEKNIVKDDLVLCEGCGLEMAKALGLTDNTELQAQLAREVEAREEAERALARQAKYASTLEDLLTKERVKPIKVDHRLKPRKPTEKVWAEDEVGDAA